MQLVVDCGGNEGGTTALPRSHSPLGLSVDGCGTASLALHCGAVLGNLALVSVVALLTALYVAVQHWRSGRPSRTILAERGLPVRVLPVAVFLLQPTVSSSLHLVWYTGGSSAVPYVVAVVGLAACGLGGALLRHMVGREMATVCGVWQVPRRRLEDTFGDYAAKALGTSWVRYEPQVCLRAVRRQQAREFLAMFGSLFQKYWGLRWWYYGAGLWASAAAGVLASVQPTSTAGCNAQRAVFVALCVVSTAGAALLRPFASLPLQTLNVALEAASVATAICVLVSSVAAVEACARLQLVLSCGGSVLSAYRMLYARRKATAKKQEHLPSFLSRSSEEELAHLLFTMSYPSQCIMQSEDRLRQLIAFIATEQQQKQQQTSPPFNFKKRSCSS